MNNPAAVTDHKPTRRRAARLGLIAATAAAITIGASGMASAGGESYTGDHITVTTATSAGRALAGATFAVYLPGGDWALGLGRSGYGATADAAGKDANLRGSQNIPASPATARLQHTYDVAVAAYVNVYGTHGKRYLAAVAATVKADAAVALAYKNAYAGPKGPTPAQLNAIKVANAASAAAYTVLNNVDLDTDYPQSAAAIRSPLGKADLAAGDALSASRMHDDVVAFAAEANQVRGKLTTSSKGTATGYAWIGGQDTGKAAPSIFVTLAETKAPTGYATVKPFKIAWNGTTAKWNLVDAAHHPGVSVSTNSVRRNGAHQLDTTDFTVKVVLQRA